MDGQPENTRIRTNRPQQKSVTARIKRALTFNSFMGCCSLRTGSLFIGYVNLIATIFVMGIYTFALVILFKRYSGNLNGAIIGYFIYLVVILISNFVFHVYLLRGVYKENRKFVIIYLRGFFWILLITFIVLVLMVIFATKYERKFFASYPPSIYCLLVVRSYYLKMGQRPQERTEMNSV